MNTLNAAVDAFSHAIGDVAGEVENRLVNATGAYCRAVLPIEEQVQSRDTLRHGAALRANQRMVQVVPFVFRQICTNGAIWSHSTAAYSMETNDSTAELEIEEFVRSSTESAASTGTFQSCLDEVRSGIRTPTDVGLLIMSMLGSRGSAFDDILLDMVLRELPRHPLAKTHYDAMNVVTAAAREVHDPEARWKMEALATTLLVGVRSDAKGLPIARSRRVAGVC